MGELGKVHTLLFVSRLHLNESWPILFPEVALMHLCHHFESCEKE